MRAGTSGVTTDPPPNHQVSKGKGKEKETEIAHMPVIDLGEPKAKGKRKPHTPPPHEDETVASPTTPHPPRIRQSLLNGFVGLGKSVLQLEPLTPTTQPNHEPDLPKTKKRKRKHNNKKSQEVAEVPKAAAAAMTMMNPGDDEE